MPELFIKLKTRSQQTMALQYIEFVCYEQLPYSNASENNGESSHNAVDEPEVDEAELELPPPMKPIQVSLVSFLRLLCSCSFQGYNTPVSQFVFVSLCLAIVFVLFII